MRRESLFPTRTDRVVFGALVLGLIVLVPFALAGHAIAEDVMLIGSGGAVSFVVAELVVRGIGNRKRAGLFLLLAWILGLVLPPFCCFSCSLTIGYLPSNKLNTV